MYFYEGKGTHLFGASSDGGSVGGPPFAALSFHPVGEECAAREIGPIRTLLQQIGYAAPYRTGQRPGSPRGRFPCAGRHPQRPPAPSLPEPSLWDRWRSGAGIPLCGCRHQYARELQQFLYRQLGKRQLPQARGGNPGPDRDGGGGTGYVGPGDD